jgi:hypothetical protein
MEQIEKGRKMLTKSLSISYDLLKNAEQRVQSLRPMVSSFSNYVQQLIELDMEQQLIRPRNFRYVEPEVSSSSASEVAVASMDDAERASHRTPISLPRHTAASPNESKSERVHGAAAHSSKRRGSLKQVPK